MIDQATLLKLREVFSSDKTAYVMSRHAMCIMKEAIRLMGIHDGIYKAKERGELPNLSIDDYELLAKCAHFSIGTILHGISNSVLVESGETN